MSIATPFKGTELYEQGKRMGYLREPPDGCIRLEAPRIEIPEFTCSDIDRFIEEGMKVNPIIPIGRLRLALRVFLTNPLRAMKLSVIFLIRKRVKWA